MKTKEEIEMKLLAVMEAGNEMLKKRNYDGYAFFNGKEEALKWALGEYDD